MKWWRRCTDHGFIEKSVVYGRKQVDGKRYQAIDICNNGVGAVHGFRPDEMKETLEGAFGHEAQRKNGIVNNYTVSAQTIFRFFMLFMLCR